MMDLTSWWKFGGKPEGLPIHSLLVPARVLMDWLRVVGPAAMGVCEPDMLLAFSEDG